MENDIVIVPDGIIHNTTYYNEEYERILLQISKEYINPLLISKLQNIFKKRVYRPKNADEIEIILDKIEKEHKEKSDISDELIRCYITEFFAYLIRNKSIEFDDNNTETNAIISEITKYISDNFSQDISLEEMAEKAGFSKCYFSKFFKASTGFGYKEFVLLTRIREAKKLLSSTDKSICEIAFSCGFNDSNYFSSKFKMSEGISPLSYRKKAKVPI